MRNELLEVIALQREYSPENTPPMQKRGELIRHALPLELSRITAELKNALGVHGEDLAFQGRDGTGRKTLIPWVRLFSKTRSPSAQHGWYCVYLFDALGRDAYLELGHGSTALEQGTYQPRPPEQLKRLVNWAKEVLAPVMVRDPDLAMPMSLNGRELGNAYEQSAVLTRRYPATNIPSDDALFSDAVEFAGYLRLVYEAEVLGLAPYSAPPEVREVESAASGGESWPGWTGLWFDAGRTRSR